MLQWQAPKNFAGIADLLAKPSLAADTQAASVYVKVLPKLLVHKELLLAAAPHLLIQKYCKYVIAGM